MSGRLERVRQRTAEVGADAALVTNLTDIRWACGFSGSNGVLIVDRSSAHLVTDGRYTEQAARECPDAMVHIADGKLAEAVGELGLLAQSATVVIQADDMTIATEDAYADALPDIGVVHETKFLAQAVAQKDASEHAALRKAQALTCGVMADVIASLSVGMTELEVAAKIVYRHLKAGASAMSFEPIVASGPNGALPHARPSNRKLAKGDLVVIDMGGVVDGYCSDLTRTVAIGEPSDEARRVFEVVGEAQKAALAILKADVSGADLDRAARAVIEDAGYGEAFSHSLGHGVGLQVHEWPRLSQKADDIVPLGAAVTIEPGIYLSGRFGVRTEDLVVVTADGYENLTTSPHELAIV